MDWSLQWVITIRLVVAFLLGALLGYERSHQQKPAGSRTHSLVSVAAALYMVISVYGFAGANSDPGRVAAQVVTGMGFIGAGTIWKEGSWVKGLTTATTLWVAAALGLAVGVGLYLPALVTLGLALLGLELPKVRWLLARGNWVSLHETHELLEELDLGSLKAGLERIFAFPMLVHTYSSSDPYIVSFEGASRVYQDPFTLTFSIKGRTLTLVLIYVPVALRNQGYARETVRELLRWSHQHNLHQVNLTSRPEVNEFWNKLGFQMIDEFTFTYYLTS